MKKYELFTIGYEGRDIDEFVALLKQFHISRLVDVREIPFSRKKAFSKSALRERLQDEHIDYVHIKALGCPSTIRNKLKSDRDYGYFFKAFSEHLSQNIEAVKEVHECISDGNTCLMCLELSSDQCHRSIVADRIKEYGGNRLEIIHI